MVTERYVDLYYNYDKAYFNTSFIQFKPFTIYPFMCVKAPIYYGSYHFTSDPRERCQKPKVFFRMKALLYSFSRTRRFNKKVVNFSVNTKNPVSCLQSFFYEDMPKSGLRYVSADWREYSFLLRKDWFNKNFDYTLNRNDYFNPVGSPCFYDLSFNAWEIIFSINREPLRTRFLYGADYKKTGLQMELFLTVWNRLRQLNRDPLSNIDDYNGADTQFSFLVSSYGPSKPTFASTKFLLYMAKRAMVKKLRGYILNNNFLLLPKPRSKDFFNYLFLQLNRLFYVKLFFALVALFCFVKNFIFFSQEKIKTSNIFANLGKNVKFISISFFSNLYFYHRYVFKKSKFSGFYRNQSLLGNYFNSPKRDFMVKLLKNNKLFTTLKAYSPAKNFKIASPFNTLYQRPFRYAFKGYKDLLPIEKIYKRSFYFKWHSSKIKGLRENRKVKTLEQLQLSYSVKILSYLLNLFYRNNIVYCVTSIIKENKFNKGLSSTPVIMLMFFKLFTLLFKNYFPFLQRKTSVFEENSFLKNKVYKHFSYMDAVKSFGLGINQVNSDFVLGNMLGFCLFYQKSDFLNVYREFARSYNDKVLNKLYKINQALMLSLPAYNVEAKYDSFLKLFQSKPKLHDTIRIYKPKLFSNHYRRIVYIMLSTKMLNETIKIIPLFTKLDNKFTETKGIYSLANKMVAFKEYEHWFNRHNVWLNYEINRRVNYFTLMYGYFIDKTNLLVAENNQNKEQKQNNNQNKEQKQNNNQNKEQKQNNNQNKQQNAANNQNKQQKQNNNQNKQQNAANNQNKEQKQNKWKN